MQYISVKMRTHYQSHEIISLMHLSLFNWHFYAITLCPFKILSTRFWSHTQRESKNSLFMACVKLRYEWTFALDIQKAFFLNEKEKTAKPVCDRIIYKKRSDDRKKKRVNQLKTCLYFLRCMYHVKEHSRSS